MVVDTQNLLIVKILFIKIIKDKDKEIIYIVLFYTFNKKIEIL